MIKISFTFSQLEKYESIRGPLRFANHRRVQRSPGWLQFEIRAILLVNIQIQLATSLTMVGFQKFVAA